MNSGNFHTLGRTIRHRRVSTPAATPTMHAILLIVLLLMLSLHGAARADVESIAPLLSNTYTEDLDVMRKHGVIRVLVTYKKTEYFVVNGRQHGFEYELMEQYEKLINKGRKKGQLPIDIVYIPVPFQRLIPSLLEGHGESCAAGMTITPKRKEQVAFTIPYFKDVSEVLVTHKTDKSIRSTDDLSGRVMYVLNGSSYVQHLEELSNKFKEQGRPPVYIVESDRYLATEDILELINANVVEVSVADNHIAELWANVLPNIAVHKEIAINSSGEIAWAVRKENTKLLADLNAFLKKNRQGSLMGNVLFKRYFEDTRWIKNPLTKTAQNNLEKYKSLFKKYAKEYDFDWLLIGALAFQESGLKPKKKSHRGAVGIMQIKPSTAKDKNVGIDDVYKLENNVHAGVKYLAFLRDRYFKGPEIEEGAGVHFSLAAYNAGPAKVRKMRARAKKMGLDPNVWFRNTEIAAQQMVGSETTRYVANIYKYYLAYTLLTDLNANKEAALEAQAQ